MKISNIVRLFVVLLMTNFFLPTSSSAETVSSAIVGQWDFNDSGDITKATIGESLELFGNNSSFVSGHGNGNGAILLGNGDYLKAVTNITPSGSGSKVNTYTLSMDIKLDNIDSYASLLQTDATNSNDGALFVKGDNKIGNGGIGYSDNVIGEEDWCRMILVSKENSATDVSIDIYINGSLFYSGTRQNVDNRLSLAESVYFCLDNDGEELPTAISQIVLYNYALTSEDAAAMGTAYEDVVAPAIVGQWDFNDSNDLTKAEIGDALELFGNNSSYVSGPGSGNGAILLGNGDYLKAAANITPSGAGVNVNTYSLIMDIKLDNIDSYASLLQTDITNNNDGDLFVKDDNKIGNGGIGYSDNTINEGAWYRMVLVSREYSASDVTVDIYLNGSLFYSGSQQSVDNRLSLAGSVFFCLDNDGEELPTAISKIVLYNYPLTSTEISDLGNAEENLTTPEIVGQWNFNDPSNLTKATIGDALELFGSNSSFISGPGNGNGAILLGNGDYLKAITNITPSGSGVKVNTYTLSMDIKLDNINGYTSLLQTNMTNSNDGDLFIKADNKIGNGTIGYSDNVITEGEWHRMMLVLEEHSADNVSIDIYLDGSLFYSGNQQNVDNRMSLDDGVFFFLDDNGEELSTGVAQIVLYNYALTSDEISDLGGAVEEEGLPTIVGQWNFNNVNNLAEATIGEPLEIFGTASFIEGPGSENGAVLLGNGDYLKAVTNITPSGSGENVNTYSLSMDIKLDNIDSYTSLLQTDITNRNDGDLFIKSDNKLGNGAIGYSDNIMNEGEWYRMILVSEEHSATDVSIDIYMNGNLFYSAIAQNVDSRMSLKESLFFCLDNDGEELATGVSQIVLYNYALTSAEVSDLGDAAIEYGVPSNEWQYPPNTTFTTIAPPSGASAPGYLSYYDDNTTSTRMKQITQEGGVIQSYPKRQTWNIDETKYKLHTVAVYDANTHNLYKSLSGLDMYESIWSNTDPNIIYGFTVQGKIRRYNVETEVRDLLYDLNGSSDVYDEVKLGPGEGNIDIHDKYAALIAHVKNSSDMRIIIFNLQNSQIVTTKTFAGMWRNADWQHQYIDWVSVSQSGDYVGIMWNHNYATEDNPYVDNDGSSHYGVEMYNTINLSYLRRIVRYGNHGDFGFAPDGTEVFVQFYGNVHGEYGSVFSYHLDGSGVDIILTDEVFEHYGSHISCRNILRPGWAYLNTKNYGNGDGRMIAVKLDGSKTIENFGHSFEVSGDDFYAYAAPVPNPSGTKIMFKSNFGNTASEDKICSYEAYPIPSGANKSYAADEETSEVIPIKYALEQNFPNPFNPTTVIHFSIPKQSNVKLSVYNLLGEKVAELVNGDFSAGNYEVNFNASNLASGMYIYRISAGSYTDVKKMLFLK